MGLFIFSGGTFFVACTVLQIKLIEVRGIAYIKIVSPGVIDLHVQQFDVYVVAGDFVDDVVDDWTWNGCCGS